MALEPKKVPDGESMYASWGIAEGPEGENRGELYCGYTFTLGDDSLNFSIYQFFTPIIAELEQAFRDVNVNWFTLTGSIFNPRKARRALQGIKTGADRLNEIYPGPDPDSTGFSMFHLAGTPEGNIRAEKEIRSNLAGTGYPMKAAARAEHGARMAAGLV